MEREERRNELEGNLNGLLQANVIGCRRQAELKSIWLNFWSTLTELKAETGAFVQAELVSGLWRSS